MAERHGLPAAQEAALADIPCEPELHRAQMSTWVADDGMTGRGLTGCCACWLAAGCACVAYRRARLMGGSTPALHQHDLQGLDE